MNVLNNLQEKGSTPLHVASKSGQSCQIELLIVYGANIIARDSKGHTAYDIALHNKHAIIADRLIEALYEVTDRLTYFLTGKKADHSSGKHLLVPDQNHTEITEQLKIARGKLQLVPNKMFEELVMDLYDEVDRREMEASKNLAQIVYFSSANNALIAYSLGYQRLESRNRSCTISANQSAFECNTQSRSPEASPI